MSHVFIRLGLYSKQCTFSRLEHVSTYHCFYCSTAIWLHHFTSLIEFPINAHKHIYTQLSHSYPTRNEPILWWFNHSISIDIFKWNSFIIISNQKLIFKSGEIDREKIVLIHLSQMHAMWFYFVFKVFIFRSYCKDNRWRKHKQCIESGSKWANFKRETTKHWIEIRVL